MFCLLFFSGDTSDNNEQISELNHEKEEDNEKKGELNKTSDKVNEKNLNKQTKNHKDDEEEPS